MKIKKKSFYFSLSSLALLCVSNVHASIPTLELDSSSNTGTYLVKWNKSHPNSNGRDVKYELVGERQGSLAIIQDTACVQNKCSVERTVNSDGNYSYKVRVIDSGLAAAFSSIKTISVNLARPGVPDISGPNEVFANTNYTVTASTPRYTDTFQFQGEKSGYLSSIIPSEGPDSSNLTRKKASGMYAYKVRACNGDKCSNWSNKHTVMVGAPTISGPDTSNNGTYTLSWGGMEQNANWYRLIRLPSGSGKTFPNTRNEILYEGALLNETQTQMSSDTYNYVVSMCISASNCSSITSPVHSVSVGFSRPWAPEIGAADRPETWWKSEIDQYGVRRSGSNSFGGTASSWVDSNGNAVSKNTYGAQFLGPGSIVAQARTNSGITCNKSDPKDCPGFSFKWGKAQVNTFGFEHASLKRIITMSYDMQVLEYDSSPGTDAELSPLVFQDAATGARYKTSSPYYSSDTPGIVFAISELNLHETRWGDDSEQGLWLRFVQKSHQLGLGDTGKNAVGLKHCAFTRSAKAFDISGGWSGSVGDPIKGDTKTNCAIRIADRPMLLGLTNGTHTIPTVNVTIEITEKGSPGTKNSTGGIVNSQQGARVEFRIGGQLVKTIKAKFPVRVSDSSEFVKATMDELRHNYNTGIYYDWSWNLIDSEYDPDRKLKIKFSNIQFEQEYCTESSCRDIFAN